jgi:nitrite reductase (NADH) small subunit
MSAPGTPSRDRDDLPPGGRGRIAVGEPDGGGVPAAVGELRAIDAVCPHSGGPLADGQFDAKKVICPLHNYLLLAGGRDVPNGDYAVRAYPVREEVGKIVVVA